MQKLVIFLRMVGIGLVLLGIVAAYYGPLEIFVFYLFSEGGRFHYAGSGMGSLWFAALVVMNIGYYAIAALCIPVGIGHVLLRRWALTLTHLYLWFWLGAGILLFVNCVLLGSALFRLESYRGFEVAQVIAVASALLFFLVLAPVLALKFYASEKVKSVFRTRDPNTYWTERYPFPLLALLLLFVIMILTFHIAIFFQGLFPLFGQIVLGRPAAYAIAFCILVLGILIYGTVRLKTWAWWGSLGYVALLTLSSVMSFSGHSFSDIVGMMNPPAYEMELIDRMVVLHDYSLASLLSAPLLAALGLIIYSRRYFRKGA